MSGEMSGKNSLASEYYIVPTLHLTDSVMIC